MLKYDQHGNTAMELYHACDVGDLEVVESMIDQNVDPNQLIYFNRKSKYPIENAIENGHHTVVEHLIRNSDIDLNVKDFLSIASSSGYDKIVELLLENDIDPSQNDNNSIILASTNGHAKVVEVLLTDERTDPTQNNNEALVNASTNGHTEVVRVLINDYRIDPTINENRALVKASKKLRGSVMMLLLEDERVFNTLNTIPYDRMPIKLKRFILKKINKTTNTQLKTFLNKNK